MFGPVASDVCTATGHLFELEKCHQECPISVAQLLHGLWLQLVACSDIHLISKNITALYQAFPHICTASNKCWVRRPGMRLPWLTKCWHLRNANSPQIVYVYFLFLLPVAVGVVVGPVVGFVGLVGGVVFVVVPNIGAVIIIILITVKNFRNTKGKRW